MTEDFLHYLWKYRLYDATGLETTNGEAIEVIKPGEHNKNAGPDFFTAQVKIGQTHWAGNVEIHTKTSDWKKHAHDSDTNYQNLILHVVYENDIDMPANVAPTLELKGRISRVLLERYASMMESQTWIPCEKMVNMIEHFTIHNWLDRLLVERLERKSAEITNLLKVSTNNLEQTFYIWLARNFGFKLNAEPFELLAKSLPITILAKHKNHLHQVEAMLFGQAGMLDQDFEDEYPISLKKEYLFLKKKFNLQPISGSLWKLLRLRPVNFPTLRIAQFASLLHRSSGLFSQLLETNDPGNMTSLLDVESSVYWDTHYVFDKSSQPKRKRLGRSAIENILINSVVPFLFIYGNLKQQQEFKDRSINLLEHIKSEKNAIIDKFKSLGIGIENAGNSQALLELKSQYCDSKKCLNCAIGNSILRKK